MYRYRATFYVYHVFLNIDQHIRN